jgi:transcriptional antiterminator RfaH
MVDQRTHWYCVKTRANKEASVESLLRTRLGVETYFPKWKCRRPVAGTLRWVVRPLFPTYLFARFDLETNQRNVTFARDVQKIVSFGEGPAPVGDSLIDDLKGYSVEAGGDLFQAEHRFKPGDEVIVEAGVFKKWRGLFERELSDGQRVAILLNLLQQQTSVTLPKDYIRPVYAEHPLSVK